MSQRIFLSPSGLASYENCPNAYYLDRVLKVRTRRTSSNLGFGGAAASAMEGFLQGQLRQQWVDPVNLFVEHWRMFTNSHDVVYKRGLSKEDLNAIGIRLMELFPKAWAKTRWSVVVDNKGEPLIERKFMVDIGNDVVLVTKLDVVVRDDEGKIYIIDMKTPSSPSSVAFTLMGDQLTAYQIAMMTYGPLLGVGEVAGVGYWELIKRKIPQGNRGEGPVIHDPIKVAPRSNGQLQAFVEKAHETADRIRASRFPKTPRMAWNSPCSSCELSSLCISGETKDLVFPSDEVKHAALKLAA